MNEHYIYFYIDPRDGKVFYIGCGKGRRMWVHLRPSVLKIESPKTKLISEILATGIHPMIAVVEWGLTQAESLNRERFWIAYYGKGNLTNKTTGGQGCRGVQSFKGKHHTAETCEKLRKSKLGSRNPMFGKKRTKEALLKFSEKMSGSGHPRWGKPLSQTVKDKISLKLSGCVWSKNDCKKRSRGMKAVWEKRRKGLVSIPKHQRKMIECRGENLSINEWVDKTGIKKATILARLRRGVSTSRALGME